MSTFPLIETSPAGGDFHDTVRSVLPVVGRSAAVAEMLALVESLAGTDTTVLISGESGAGKELVARLLHETGRRPGVFLAHNCAAIAEGTLESDLFGHAAGAFTGALGVRRGLFEEAQGGTAFLDEIGEIGPRLQAQLLRVLQEGEIRRVGESRPRRVQVRILAATNRSLQDEVRRSRFREDLFYRLNVVEVRVPSLLERRPDITIFVQRFLAESARAGESCASAFTPQAMEKLLSYSWPGNVRQLRNEVLRAALLTRGRGPIGPQDFSEELREVPSRGARVGSLREQVDQAQRGIVLGTLERHGWNKTRAARSLGITRQGLIKMIHRLGLPLQGVVEAED
ncbi:MAG: sigma 54-interacting transcriptional regulator [Candidatus Eiseniibacteriota bacterium]